MRVFAAAALLAAVAAVPTPSQPLAIERRDIALLAAVPAPTQSPAVLALERRDIAASITAYIASAVPTGIAGGILSIPSTDGILDQFNIAASAYDAQPAHFLNLKGYANWSTATGQWYGRVHGLLYKVRWRPLQYG